MAAWNQVKGYFKVVKDCGNAANTNCIPVYQTLVGAASNYGDSRSLEVKTVLADGVILDFVDYPGNCTEDRSKSDVTPLKNVCASLLVDTNGAKPPNRMGRDAFHFYLLNNGAVVPLGTQDDTASAATYCVNDPNATGPDNGSSCGARVLEEGAINY